MGKPAARSVYNGLRLTVTQHPQGGPAIVTVATKGPHGKWDDWSLLFPAMRLETPPLATATDVALLLERALEQLQEELHTQ